MKKLNVEDNWHTIYQTAIELELTVIGSSKSDVVRQINKEIDKKNRRNIA